jgi:DNA mismatch repair protein MutS2
VIAKARAEAELEVAVLKRNIESLKSQLKKARQPLEALKQVEEMIEEIEEKVEEPVERRPRTEDRKPSPSTIQRPLALGERVTVSTLNADGVVTALSESDAEVQVGSLRIRAKLSELQRKNVEQAAVSDLPGTKENAYRPQAAVSSPGLELDLRGQIAEDALEVLDRYLEKAFLAELPFVRIIHGKGTGVLRQAVREALRQNSHVTSFEEGGAKEGGEGVTVAKIG